MSALVYRYITSFKNNLRKAIRRPITYIYLAGIIGYFFIIVRTGKEFLGTQVSRPGHVFFLAASVLTIFGMSTNLMSYAQRKGLIFTQSDVHFLFSSPVNPKLILIYAHFRALFGGVLVSIFLVVCGLTIMKISLWQIVIYLIYNFIIENIFVLALMITLYGNETIPEKAIHFIQNLLRVIVGALVLYIGFYMLRNGFSFHNAETVISSTVVQVIPILGWVTAFFELLFVGPTVVNVVCSILYGLCILFMVIWAIRMKCSGEYMEDAMKFADDYMEAKQKNAKGEVTLVGKKQKFKTAVIEYKGNGAKALFYRQLLEYKKTKWFIFGWTTVIHLALGVGSAYFIMQDKDLRKHVLLFLCGISAYVIMLFSAYVTKWQKELTSPYTFMIPDTNMKKLWYSSIIEHIRSLTNGILLILPGAVIGGAPFIGTVLVIMVFVCFSANKTYAGIMCEGLFGGVLGTTAVSMMRFAIVTTSLLISLAGVLAGQFIGGTNAAFIGFIIVSVAVTFILALISSILFDRMEG